MSSIKRVWLSLQVTRHKLLRDLEKTNHASMCMVDEQTHTHASVLGGISIVFTQWCLENIKHICTDFHIPLA